jgi:hypothetical protein
MGAMGHRTDSVNLEDLTMFRRMDLTSSSELIMKAVGHVGKKTPNPMPQDQNLINRGMD